MRRPGQLIASGAVVSPDGRHLAFVARTTRHGARATLGAFARLRRRPAAAAWNRGGVPPVLGPEQRGARLLRRGSVEASRVSTTSRRKHSPRSATGRRVGAGPRRASFSSPTVSRACSPVPELAARKPRSPCLMREREIAHQAPFFLPDGRHFLYFVLGATPETSGTYLGSLDSDDTRAPARCVVLCRIVCRTRVSALRARRQRHGASLRSRPRRRLDGAPQPIASHAYRNERRDPRRRHLCVANGILTFGGDTSMARLTWFSRDGRNVGTIQSPCTVAQSDASLPTSAMWPPTTRDRTCRSGSSISSVARRHASPRACSRSGDRAGPTSCSRRGAGGGSSDLVHRSISGRLADESLLLRTPHMKIGGNWTADNSVHRLHRLGSRGPSSICGRSRGRPHVDSVSCRAPFNEMHATGIAGRPMDRVRL